MGRVGRGLLRSLTAGAAALSLAGCVAFGNITPHVDQIDQSIGSSLNRAILLNIVRASRDEPLYFTSISQVGGSGNADLKTGLPNISIGPAAASNQLVFTNAADNSESTNFQLGVLNSHDFYEGLLRPIDLVEANLLIHQGFSREMVFSVLVDKARIHSGGAVREIRNDPADDDFQEFQSYLQRALVYGLTIETYRMANPDLAGGRARGGTAGAGAAGGGQSAAPPFVNAGKLCFDPALADPANLGFVNGSPAKCGDASGTARSAMQALTFHIGGKDESFEVILRSPFQIFQYLGGMLADGTAGKVQIGGDHAGLEPLLVVNAAGSPCFTDISYAGADYCVPDQGSDRTRQVFSLLNQILALNTSTADLPVTTTIQLTQ